MFEFRLGVRLWSAGSLCRDFKLPPMSVPDFAVGRDCAARLSFFLEASGRCEREVDLAKRSSSFFRRGSNGTNLDIALVFLCEYLVTYADSHVPRE